jgi:hypothetical protein
MAEFRSADSYGLFAASVKENARYVHSEEVRRFLATVAETSEKRRKPIESGRTLWRAQSGYVWGKEYEGTDHENEVPEAYSPDRMKPEAQYASDGRVNPRGIPCLYLASSKETAMAEVRPWLGSYISVAEFKVMRDLSLIDCSQDSRVFPKWLVTFPGPVRLSSEEHEKVAWGEIAYAFSEPIAPNDSPIAYVPTQILGEAFRSHGYDGIIYRSLLGGGFNVALFDCGAAELINCCLHETRYIAFTFEQCSNPYFVTKHYPGVQVEQKAEGQSKPQMGTDL